MKVRKASPLFLTLLILILGLSQIGLVFASGTYVGFLSTNADAASCSGSFCISTAATTDGYGTIVQAPFSGTLISASVFTGTTTPDQIVILTTGISSPTLTSESNIRCTGTCYFVNSGQSFTVQDVEGVSVGANSFVTVILANPVTISSGVWVAIVFMHKGGVIASNSFDMGSCGGASGGPCSQGTSVAAVFFSFASTNPSGSVSTSSYSVSQNPTVVGGTFQASSSSTSTVTQCYGNCGTPPITVVNTNSTHSINFNTSITVFYEFQTNLNGVINNVTLNYAQVCGSGNKCTANTLFIGAYIIGACSANSQPFTSACPGSRVSQATFSPPTKARLSMQCPSSCVVTNGQWIGISISATFSGIDINDTNTNVQLFQSNGVNPNVISQSATASNLCGGCKMGLWAWITGNVQTGPGTVSTPPTCGSGIGDFLLCLTQTFCTGTPNPGCQLAGGLFWAIVYTGAGSILLMWGDRKLAGQGEEGERIIPGQFYFFIPIGVFLMFVALGALPVWVGILIFAMAAYLLASMILRFQHGDS